MKYVSLNLPQKQWLVHNLSFACGVFEYQNTMWLESQLDSRQNSRMDHGLTYDLIDLWLEKLVTWLTSDIIDLRLDWLATWLTCNLIDLQLDWFPTWLTRDFIGWRLDWFVIWLTWDLIDVIDSWLHWLVIWLTCALIIDSQHVIYDLTPNLIDLQGDWLSRLVWLTFWLTHDLIDSQLDWLAT